MNNPFNYEWYLRDGFPTKGVTKHNLKVYSTFACGGGSSMGYKLAGFDVIGANDIDPEMAKIYKHNLKPKYLDVCPISDLLDIELPKEYYDLDILDGSPPCSTFSTSGLREKVWKKDKKFAEGQAKQKLSELFFEWIKLVDKLRPRVAIAENVKGMITGNAKAYTRLVIQKLNKHGYDVQLFLLDGSTMGLPQRRQRVFFICRRKDLKLKPIKLNFKDKPITYGEFADYKGPKLTGKRMKLWPKRAPSDRNMAQTSSRCGGKYTGFNTVYWREDETPNTLTTQSDRMVMLYSRPVAPSIDEFLRIGSFPLDYDFLRSRPIYIIGMSVPPVMMARLAHEVYNQVLNF